MIRSARQLAFVFLVELDVDALIFVDLDLLYQHDNHFSGEFRQVSMFPEVFDPPKGSTGSRCCRLVSL